MGIETDQNKELIAEVEKRSDQNAYKEIDSKGFLVHEPDFLLILEIGADHRESHSQVLDD